MSLFDYIPRRNGPTSLRDRLVLVGVGLLGLLWFHKVDFRSGFEQISGDTGDTRLVAYLLEHTWQALTGHAVLASPPMFYPAQGTFGFADAFLLQGLLYWPLRALGHDPLTALQWATLVLDGLTYATAAWLLYRVLRLGAIPSAFGAALFAFNSAKFNQIVHLQLQPLVLLPVMLALLAMLGRHADHWSPRQAFWRLAALALLLDVQLLTGVYVAWFFCFWCLIFAVLLLVFAPTRAWLLDRLRAFRLALAGAATVFAIGLIPFLVLDGPVLRQTGWRSYGDAQGMIPRWFSLLAMGDGNLLWAWVEDQLPGFTTMKFVSEHRIGLGLIVTLGWLLLAGLAVAAARRIPLKSIGSTVVRPESRIFAVILVLSVTAFYLLGMKYFGKSPWWFAFHTVPGIKSVRAVARYAVVVALPLSVALAFVLDALLNRARRWRGRQRTVRTALLIAVAAAALLEQAGERLGYSKANELARLHRLAAQLPANCAAFFITSPLKSKLSRTEVQIDAMLVAQLRNIPTLNGYSGQDPQGWHLFEVREPEYPALVQQWVRERHVPGLICELHDPD